MKSTFALCIIARADQYLNRLYSLIRECDLKAGVSDGKRLTIYYIFECVSKSQLTNFLIDNSLIDALKHFN